MIKEVIEEVPDRFTILYNGRPIWIEDTLVHFRVEEAKNGYFKFVADNVDKEFSITVQKAYRSVISTDPEEGMFDRLYPEEKHYDNS
jgi:hypothetical protein